jgi:lactate dehydrogenase-like 2-hydroxyacid dehydrogenase
MDMLTAECQTVDVNPKDQVLTRQEFLSEIKGRDGVLCMLSEKIDDEAIDAAGPQCRIFANMAVGFNNADVDAATARNVMISNTPDVLTNATADLAWTLLMAVSRRVAECDRIMRSGEWPGWGPLQFRGGDVTGRTLGIVGAGRIGAAVAQRSRGFDMNVLYHDALGPNKMLETAVGAKFTEFDELLRQSDFVSLHVPLTPETHHLISTKEFELMKSSAYLINTARGPVVDETALVEALNSGQIAGAGLDVFEDEPKMKPGLAECANAVLLPHIGSATFESRDGMATMAAGNLLAGMKGELPPNCVNPDAYAKR